MNEDPTTVEKLSACMAGFGFACLALIVSAVMIIPVTAAAASWLGLPDLITTAIIFLELFGLPVIAAIAGVSLVAQGITQRSPSAMPAPLK